MGCGQPCQSRGEHAARAGPTGKIERGLREVGDGFFSLSGQGLHGRASPILICLAHETRGPVWRFPPRRTFFARLGRADIAESLYYAWSKEFIEAGKRRLAGDTARAATTNEVRELRLEPRALKEVVAEQALELRLLKKSMIAAGDDRS